MKLEYSRQIFNKFSNIKFHEIHSVWDELFHVDRQTERPTDIKELIIILRNFANESKNDFRYYNFVAILNSISLLISSNWPTFQHNFV